jgi:Uma2 family endonuclease
MEEKVADYLDAGARMVWVIDPRRREAAVHRPGRAQRILRAADALDGEDVLPGFRLGLDELFG